MKKIIFLTAIVIVFMSCNKEAPKDYVTLFGTITNPVSDSLVVTEIGSVIKKIDVNEDGTFSDTLKVRGDKYFITHGNAMAPLFLKNGYNLQIDLDAKELNKTIVFTGKGADDNTFLKKSHSIIMKSASGPSILELEEEMFEQKLTQYIESLSSLLKNTKNLDPTLISLQNIEIDRQEKLYRRLYKMDDYLATVLAKGNVSPKFVDYENYAGGTISLDDFKGKFVYIDVWATTCAPCIKEFPFLKNLEAKYRGKNIAFVSISTDSPKRYDKWKAMVAEKELLGTQLYDNDDKTFSNAYKIVYIPRFILVDPDGNIVSADAPRPSDEKLITLFDEAGI